MRRVAAFAVAALISPSAQAAPSDALCQHLRAFEAASLPSAQRRWVEFHWGYDKTAFWSWGCRHSDDKLAKATCDWLMDNTSHEFAMKLPQDLMACHGYRFPKFAFYDWSGVAGAFELKGASDRRVVMDLNYRDLPGGEVAVRVAVEQAGKSYQLEDLPPIRPMAAGAAPETP